MKKVLSLVLVAMMLLTVFAVVATADDFKSVDSRDYYKVEAKIDNPEGGTVIANPTTPKKGETSTITAKIADGYTFTGWTFVGDFDWVSGDANSTTIVIRPKGDVIFTAGVKKTSGGKTPSKDDGPKSPATGYNTEAVIVAMAAVLTVSAAAVAFTGKKYFCEK